MQESSCTNSQFASKPNKDMCHSIIYHYQLLMGKYQIRVDSLIKKGWYIRVMW